VVARETLLNVVPIFVAIMVWLIRVLIIGTISMAGDRLFSQAVARQSRSPRISKQRRGSQTTTRGRQRSIRPLNNNRSTPLHRGINASSFNPSPKPETTYSSEASYEPIEPTYSPVSFDSKRKEHHSGQVRF
jgi:hypothetical protein